MICAAYWDDPARFERWFAARGQRWTRDERAGLGTFIELVKPGVDRYVFEHLGRPSGQLAGMRIPAGVIYSVIAHPNDGSVWGAVPGPMPGHDSHIAYRGT